MTFVERLRECTRSTAVRICLLLLLLLLIGVGVFLLLKYSSDEVRPKSLTVIPPPEQGGLIHFVASDRESVRNITRQIEAALLPYNVSNSNVYKGCNFFNNPPLGKTCNVDLKAFDPCVKERLFMYNRQSPCVFLKLSRSADFVPQFYNASNLPEDMPNDLKYDITELNKTNPKNLQIIWVFCEGKTQLDKDNAGSITYLPRQGFPGYFYPCTSEVGCTEPLIAIYFQRPKLQTQINVQCKLWAQNLQETIDFELLID